MEKKYIYIFEQSGRSEHKFWRSTLHVTRNAHNTIITNTDFEEVTFANCFTM